MERLGGEASYVAPFGSPTETRHWDKHWGPRLSHAAYLHASHYFIAWFKNGTFPKIAEDALYYFYRLHPQALPGLKKPGGAEPAMARPGGADKLLDDVFVSAFLTAPARLTFHSGDTLKSFDLVSGLSHVSMPFAPGRQRFVLTRGNATIIEKTGEQEISATNAWGNTMIVDPDADHPRGAGDLCDECLGQLQHLSGRGHALSKDTLCCCFVQRPGGFRGCSSARPEKYWTESNRR